MLFPCINRGSGRFGFAAWCTRPNTTYIPNRTEFYSKTRKCTLFDFFQNREPKKLSMNPYNHRVYRDKPFMPNVTLV